MTQNLRKFSTLSPISSPLNVIIGVDQSSDQYLQMLVALSHAHPHSIAIHFQQDKQSCAYDSIDVDSRDHRLLLWQHPQFPQLKIHVFANNIAVVELSLEIASELSASEAEKACQHLTVALIEQVYPLFVTDLLAIVPLDPTRILQSNETDHLAVSIHWISRTLLLTKQDTQMPSNHAFIQQWLKNTQRPEDADDLINGTIHYSMSWLNYIIVDVVKDDPQISTMILAQYFYTAQENCNKLLKQAIDSAYNETSLSIAEKKLSTSRVLSRLHQIDLYEHKKYLNRSNRKLLDEILSCWDFEQLSQNSLRMIEICSSRLEEADNKKRERSTVMTDLLLVTLSFFAVFELSLYLTELSREMMSRPALAYNDEKSSFFLNLIAGIDVDIMFVFGFALTLALVFVYKRIKSK